MKKLLVLALVLLLPISAAGCAAGKSQPSATATNKPEYKKILPMDVEKMMDGGDDILIVDVRTAEEFSSGHLKGALNIPVETISDEKPAELPDLDAMIIIYCRTGNRTRTAYEKLAALGYTNVYDMGGIVDWPGETVTETAAATDSAPSSNDASETVVASPGGILSTFSSTDIGGNPVDETLLSGKKLTMVNIWATFCGPCLEEMPDLGALNKEYADQDFQVVGIVVDVTGSDGAPVPDMIDTVEEIIDKTGADYLHILPSQDLAGLLSQA